MALVNFAPATAPIKRRKFSYQNPSYRKNPPINIEEGTDGFTIHMAVPGIEKDRIQLDVQDDQLIISSKTEKTADTAQDINYLRKEYDYSSFRKAFNLNDDIDHDNISAQLNNGVLTITLGLKEEAKPIPPRTISIQ